MTKVVLRLVIGHWSFVGHWDLVIGHLQFTLCQPPRDMRVRRIPLGGVARLVFLHVKAIADDRARFGERLPVRRHRLHEDVPDRGPLDRPGDHRASARVGRHLVQQFVLRPAADDVDRRRSFCRARLPGLPASGDTSARGFRGTCARYSPRLAGASASSACRTRSIFCGISPGERNGAVIGIDHGAERLRAARPSASARRSCVRVPPSRTAGGIPARATGP